MIRSAINELRCRLGSWVIRKRLYKSYWIARKIAPTSTSLIRHRKRNPPALILPALTHVIYHQSTVDNLCAENCFKSLAGQIRKDEQVIVVDVGETLTQAVMEHFSCAGWKTLFSVRTDHNEMRSYTYGLNLAVESVLADRFIVWRTDYVFGSNMTETYRVLLEGNLFASPYEVLVGNPEVNSEFVSKNWDRITPEFDQSFWRSISKVVSLYETQDPALFGIRKHVWDKIGGLNHELWGYGWQFAEFAARVRVACQANEISYFHTDPPLHQTHEGTLMHGNPERASEAQNGIERFSNFLGSKAAFEMYGLVSRLPPEKAEIVETQYLKKKTAT